MVRDQPLFRPPRDMAAIAHICTVNGPGSFLGEATAEYIESRNLRLHTLPTHMM
jgi:hypothetical protein